MLGSSLGGGCSGHPWVREARDAQGILVPRPLWAEALAWLVSWQCSSLILLPPIPPILPSLSCLPLQIWDPVLQQTPLVSPGWGCGICGWR